MQEFVAKKACTRQQPNTTKKNPQQPRDKNKSRDFHPFYKIIWNRNPSKSCALKILMKVAQNRTAKIPKAPIGVPK